MAGIVSDVDWVCFSEAVRLALTVYYSMWYLVSAKEFFK